MIIKLTFSFRLSPNHVAIVVINHSNVLRLQRHTHTQGTQMQPKIVANDKEKRPKKMLDIVHTLFNGTDTTIHSFVYETMTIVAHTDQHMRYNSDITAGKKT